MGQVVDSESVLLFDDVSQDETEGVSFHQLIKPGPVRRKNAGREEELFGRVFSEDLKAPAPEHPLHRGRIFKKRGPHRGNFSGKGIHFPLERFDFLRDLLGFHGRQMTQELLPDLNPSVRPSVSTESVIKGQNPLWS